MTKQTNTRSFYLPPKKFLLKRIAIWTRKQWTDDPRPLLGLILALVIGIIATLLDYNTGWFLLLWISIVIGVVFFGVLYFMWNVASIAVIFLLERKEISEEEQILMKYWLRRNIFITGLWAGILLMSLFALHNLWALFAAINSVSLAFIIMFAEHEESPFDTGI